MPVDQWLKMLKDERGISPQQYGNDIIWPTLALRKLAASRLQPTPEEIERATETYYGPAVKARLIACTTREKAEQVHAQAVADPDDFGELAKNHSSDVASASLKGQIQPIRRHIGSIEIERVAFSLRPGEISPIIPVANQFVILKCEEHLPPRTPPANFQQTVVEQLKESKMREVAGEIFKQLQAEAVVENIFNDPEKSRRMPGVAALINDRKVSTLELAEECIARHGTEVLAGMISRRILEQECKRRSLAITEQDEEQEILRAALAMGKVDASGRPDRQAWLEHVTKEQGIAEDIYIHDAVWPSVALKKLVGDAVTIDEEDLKKGFEANYGPRVRCLAIVLDNQRRAQEVWAMARDNPTSEFFSSLSEQYSVEANVRALRGEVKPIQMHGGQPQLEEEAFKLEPGQMSGIIQVGDKFVILRCEGRTTPTPVNEAEVRPLIYEDLYEKKLRLAMAKEYDRLMEYAQIDNYLAGTSQPGLRGGPGTGPQQVPRATRQSAPLRK
jgi:parvulin-like peptidyl-prolyl isomerase